MIWRGGELPEDAPPFENLLSHDLMSYGYALLEHALELTDANGADETSRRGFEYAATAIEAVISNGLITPESGFHRVVAAGAFHLARFSARAYSLLQPAQFSDENSVGEQCLTLLMLRDLDGLAKLVSEGRDDERASDSYLTDQLRVLLEPGEGEEEDQGARSDVLDVVDAALTDAFFGAISLALLAFERGEEQLLDTALERLRIGLHGAGVLNMVPQWWCHRLAIHLLRELWQSSFHVVLPRSSGSGSGSGSRGGGGEWDDLREMFIASLFRRQRSEIEVWPSQLEAAARVLDTKENLVLSLPTSAGKTRIAELCILATLAEGKRVVFVTPLRALSAQTEAVLERTFVPLGKTISSLYGTTGVSQVDESILRDRDIVVATPEKLDFALRNDPDLLDDVGLVVLDEGHMIGLNEREVRYEVQIQQLLRRPDAAVRRIVCLSAILPSGNEIEDFVGWLTNDKPGGLISSDWRPTTLRYGEVVWRGADARLNVTVGDEEPYIPRFLTESTPPSKRRTTPFPHNQQELTLATAWRLIDDKQTVLIFCPLKSSVNALASEVVKLNRQGALPSVFDGDPRQLETALAIGSEWFGLDHPILSCLKLGVAVHHGSLPGPYRKEIERLLQRGILKITISSPTLAQGLNLSASALVIHSLWRFGKIIEPSEFRNIVGRAGRAFVDSSGLIVHPMFEPSRRARRNWSDLVADTKPRDMQSGLVRLLLGLLGRMQQSLGEPDLDRLSEYVTNTAAWSFPVVADESEADASSANRLWTSQVASLDSALLSLINDVEIEERDVAAALDRALSSSLWARTIAHKDQQVQIALRAGLLARCDIIWRNSTPAQRKGYYLAGVGFETGRQLDRYSGELSHHLRVADASIMLGVEDQAVESIIEFARIVLAIVPFTPRVFPNNWEEILADWLGGRPVVEIRSDDSFSAFEFIEECLAYRLPWALESVRVRATAHKSADSNVWDLGSPDLGLAVAAVEAGTLNRSAALLMRAGFASRSGAIVAVASTGATFTSLSDMHSWLNSDLVREMTNDVDWPTPPTRDVWVSFVSRTTPPRQRIWHHEEFEAAVNWYGTHEPTPGDPYRAISIGNDETELETADAQRVGKLVITLNPRRHGLLRVTARNTPNSVELSYLGPADLTP